MADMQTLTINGATYTIKDATARKDITDLKSAITHLEADGTTRFDMSFFTRGSLNINTGALINGYDYRVSTANTLLFNKAVAITPVDGYRIYTLLMDYNTVTQAIPWRTDTLLINANQRFKFVIARVTENTEEIADIDMFVNMVSVSTYISMLGDRIGKIEEDTETPTVIHSVNVLDLNNPEMIIQGKFLNSSGDVTDNADYCLIKIPVNGIDGNKYNLYASNTAGTGFIAATTRFAMYTDDNTKIALLFNGSSEPAIVSNASCRYLYTTASKELVQRGLIMVLVNANNATIPIWNTIAYNEHVLHDFHWYNKVWASYGDSITAVNNGFEGKGWGNFINSEYGFSKSYGRGIGGQTYKWGTNGGAVAFINTLTGEYVDRNGNYNFDNFPGPVPEGCTAVRGAMCSWLRIKTMFPESIKDEINMVYIMAGSNDTYTPDEQLTWIPNNTTDTEWAKSEYYDTYGGDYNIETTIGACASTIMKFQAWMPNAVIILGTPPNGNTETNPTTIRPDYIPDEYYKAEYIRKVAAIYGIPLIDVFETSGINMLNAPAYITDGVHPYNLEGCKMIARAIIGGLKTVYPK